MELNSLLSAALLENDPTQKVLWQFYGHFAALLSSIYGHRGGVFQNITIQEVLAAQKSTSQKAYLINVSIWLALYSSVWFVCHLFWVSCVFWCVHRWSATRQIMHSVRPKLPWRRWSVAGYRDSSGWKTSCQAGPMQSICFSPPHQTPAKT